ncbi:MAG: ABC transporter permease [Clostridia bacterium]|nr:ABC transporter permease [Clostridia bacterium]
MSKMKNARAGLVLMTVGAILCVYSVWGIFKTPALCQYVTIAPESGEIPAVLDIWDERRDSLGEVYGATVYTSSYSSSVAGTQAAQATVFGVSEGYLDAHPKYIIEGSWFDLPQLSAGTRAIVLDEAIAFILYPGGEALGKTVELADGEYRVTGVVRASQTPGDVDDYAVYVPLRSLKQSASLLIADCLATSASDARALEEAARVALGEGGETHYLQKEIMRAWMLARLLIVAFGMFALLRALRSVNSRLSAYIARLREELKTAYLRDMIAQVAKSSFGFVLGYCVLAALGAFVLSLLIKPMYVFTEWIPEVFVEWSSIWDRASRLIKDFARPVKLQTREMAAVSYYALILRWGVIALLAGCVERLWARVSQSRDIKRRSNNARTS